MAAMTTAGTLDPDDDIALARAAAHGDEDALRTILTRITPRLRGIAWRMWSNHHDAEDLCQEALIKATSRTVLSAFRGEGSLDGYLLTAGTREMLSAARSRRIRDRDTQPYGEVPEPALVSASDADVGEMIDRRLQAELLRFPEQARKIFVMKALGEMSDQEVAESLGIPIGTVKSAYSRARQSLRASLGSSPTRMEAA